MIASRDTSTLRCRAETPSLAQAVFVLLFLHLGWAIAAPFQRRRIVRSRAIRETFLHAMRWRQS